MICQLSLSKNEETSIVNMRLQGAPSKVWLELSANSKISDEAVRLFDSLDKQV